MNAFSSSSVTQGSRPIVCRAIADEDLPVIADLLVEGFPERSRDYWSRGFARLRARPAMADYPRYGYLVAIDDVPVGCILLVVAKPVGGATETVRANVSSWYVRPAYRFLASMLVSKVFRRKELTFLNISPAPHTVPILLAQGYRKYVGGQIVMRPTPGGARRTKVARWRDGFDDDVLSVDETRLLRCHVDYGCRALVGRDDAGSEPFVFSKTRPVRGLVPAVQLLWCRDIASMTRFAGAIGRYFLLRGIPAVVIDANEPIKGVCGTFRYDRSPKFYRGPNPPRLSDLADTELAIFGI